jgi:dTDP-glucose 4,6-dehydratase
MNPQNIVVLGSNSFAGSQYIASALSCNRNIMGINRSNESNDLFLPYKKSQFHHHYQFLQLDLNNDFERICFEIENFKPQVIVDFVGQGMVAESWQHPEQWYQTNIVSKVKLHQFLCGKSWLQKYIRISTPEVYGSSDTLIDESAAYNPSTPYAVSHAAIDMSLKAYFKQFTFPVIFTRFSNFYGPGQQLYRIIPRTIIYALTGQKLMLHGGGHAVRAFIHADDVSQSIQAVIERGQLGETYHFSSNDFVTIKSLVEQIHHIMKLEHQDLVQTTEDRLGKDLKYLMNDSKAQTELGWQQQIALTDGITQTIDWVKNNLIQILKSPLNYQHKE